MTPERLEQIRQHILNPPSASLNREMMLELVREVVRLNAFVAEMHGLEPASDADLKTVFAESTAMHVADAASGRAGHAVVDETFPPVDPEGMAKGAPFPVVIDDRKPVKKGHRK